MYFLHPFLGSWLSKFLFRLLLSRLLYQSLLQGSQTFMIQSPNKRFCNLLDELKLHGPSFLKNRQGLSSQEKTEVSPERLSYGWVLLPISPTTSHFLMKDYSLTKLVKPRTIVNTLQPPALLPQTQRLLAYLDLR